MEAAGGCFSLKRGGCVHGTRLKIKLQWLLTVLLLQDANKHVAPWAQVDRDSPTRPDRSIKMNLHLYINLKFNRLIPKTVHQWPWVHTRIMSTVGYESWSLKLGEVNTKSDIHSTRFSSPFITSLVARTCVFAREQWCISRFFYMETTSLYQYETMVTSFISLPRISSTQLKKLYQENKF
jgi:hypothetical protein